MKIRLQPASNFLICLMVILGMGAGCVQAPPKSGFLRDYSALHSDPQDGSLAWYEAPGANWKQYSKLMIDPVVLYFHSNAQNRQVEPEALAEMTRYFRDTVVEAVKDLYPVVDAPGSGVLRVRLAITDLVPANLRGQATSAVPAGIPVDMRVAAMEAEFLDSETGEPLGAVVDRKVVIPVDIEAHVKGFTRWEDAKTAVGAWAELLKASLDEVHDR